jgi:hypothetical protein
MIYFDEHGTIINNSVFINKVVSRVKNSYNTSNYAMLITM